MDGSCIRREKVAGSDSEISEYVWMGLNICEFNWLAAVQVKTFSDSGALHFPLSSILKTVNIYF